MDDKSASTEKKSLCEISRQELLTLHNHYQSVLKDQLDFFYKYLNFYTALFSALLSGTITGVLALKPSINNCLYLVLLIGPGLVLPLCHIAYKNVVVYYRRFLEALINTYNIQSMLGNNNSANLTETFQQSILFPSNDGGFIARYNRKPIKDLINQASEEGLTAENLVEKLHEKGDTLLYAKKIFCLFGLAAIILIGVLIAIS